MGESIGEDLVIRQVALHVLADTQILVW